MNEKLIEKAYKLRSRGFTTGEIADELNVSKDTARWLILQGTGTKKSETTKEAPIDFAINWKSLGGSSIRMKYVSAALADMAQKYGEPEVIAGITVSGIPFATMMAELIGVDIAVFHPLKHRKRGEGQGSISDNFASVQGRKVVVVDDVITSGGTIAEAVKAFKKVKAKPLAAVVLIDKKGLSEVDKVPVESLIRVSRLG